LFLCPWYAFSVSTPWSQWQSRIDKVGLLNDPVMWNYQVSQGYYDLGKDFQMLLNVQEPFNVVWPTIATWASSSVGVTIRKELPSGWFQSVTQSLPKELVNLLLAFPKLTYKLFASSGILDKTSAAVAEGNKVVWLEVGSAIAKFGVRYNELTHPNETIVAAFNKTFCNDNVCQILKGAMYWYYRAKFQQDPKLKVEYIFAGNMLVGLSEQTRLDLYINRALIHGNFTFNVFGKKFVLNIENIITKFLICLIFPNEFLDAGDDVPPFQSHDWPNDLVTFKSNEVKNIYLQFVNQTTSLKGSAAKNWGILSQRMRYVIPLFRSRQQDAYAVSCPPFTPKQSQMILNGIKPDSKDLCLSANCCGKS